MTSGTVYWRALCLVCCLVAQYASALGTAAQRLTGVAHTPYGSPSAKPIADVEAGFRCHLRLVGVEAQRPAQTPRSCTIPGYSAGPPVSPDHLFAIQDAHMLCEPSQVSLAGQASISGLSVYVDDSGQVANISRLQANMHGASVKATLNPQADCGLENAAGCVLYLCWPPGSARTSTNSGTAAAPLNTRLQIRQRPSQVPTVFDVIVTVNAEKLQRYAPQKSTAAPQDLLCFGGGIRAAVLDSTFDSFQGITSVHCHGNATCFVHNSTFKDGSSSTGVQASGRAAVWIANSTFFNNTNEPCVASKQASLKIVGQAMVSTLNGTMFYGNDEGAVATYQQGSLVLSQSTFLNNTALLAPALVLHDSGSCTIASDVVFRNNRARDVGGAILLRDTTHLFVNASEVGGQMELFGVTSLDKYCSCITGVSSSMRCITCGVTSGPGVAFLNNFAREQGGSIYLEDSSALTVAEKASCIFSGGSSFNGGAITATKSSNVFLAQGAHVVFVNNTVLSAGGAISLSGSSRMTSRAHLVFLNNTSESSGGALCVVDKSNVSLQGFNYFRFNQAWRGGALFFRDNAALVMAGVNRLLQSQADDSGGAIYASDYSEITLAGEVVLAHNNASSDGGGVLLSRHAVVHVSGNVSCVNNNAFSGNGGCASAQGNVQIVTRVEGLLSIRSNSAARSGGGMHVSGPSKLSITNSSKITLDTNTAHDGGGLAVVNSAQLVLQGKGQLVSQNNSAIGVGGGCQLEGVVVVQPHAHLSVRGNNASVGGGGIYLGQQQVPGTQVAAVAMAQKMDGGNRSALIEAISGSSSSRVWPDKLARVLAQGSAGNSAPLNKELALPPRTLRPLTPTHITAYVSRRRLEDGLLPLAVVVEGVGNWPVQGVVLSATYAGGKNMIGGTTLSGPSGVANFSSLKLQDRPGTYTVTVRAGGQPQLQAVNVSVQIRQCVKGEVCPDSSMTYCDICTPGSYSFNPANTSCDVCPEQASCPGGNILVPLPGFWHSAPDSPQVHRCLHAAACGGSRLDLAGWQRQFYAVGHAASSTSSLSTYSQLQCSPGHTGHLCAVCMPGYGLERTFACSSCMPPATWVALFVLAALLSCGVIRLLAHLTWAENSKAAAALSFSTPVQAIPSNQSLGGHPSQSRLLSGSSCSNQSLGGHPSQSRLLSGSSCSNQSLGGHPSQSRLQSGSSCSNQSLGSHPSQSRLLSGSGCSSQLGHQPAPVTPGDVLKTLVVFVQYCFIIGSMRVEWPAALSACFTALSWLWSSSNGQALSIDCMPVLVHSTSSSQRALARVLFHLLSPAALLLLLMVVESAVWQAKRHLSQLFKKWQPPAGRLNDHLIIIAMVGVFFFYPALVQVVFSMFVCVTVDDPGFLPYGSTGTVAGSYWAFDMQQGCWVGYHRRWMLGVGALAGLPVLVGVPAAIAGLLQANRMSLALPLFSARYNFLYRCYREQCTVWGSIELVETAALVAVAVFGHSIGLHYQALLMNCVLAVMLLLLLVFRPYAAPRLQRLRVAGLVCLLVASYVVLTFIMPTAVPGSTFGTANVATVIGSLSSDTAVVTRGAQVWKEIAGALIVILGVLYLVLCVRELARAIDWAGLRKRITDCCSAVSWGSGLCSRHL